MFGSTGILIALIVLTIVLAAVFLVRSSITVGATGKILAFVGLCALPALSIGTGMSFQNQRSKQTRFCISCHELQGKSLYLLNPNYIPAHHFQDHLVPPDMACYSCHTDYAIYGPFRDKLRGLWNISIQYLSTPPKTIHMPGGYSNLLCLQCHAGTRDFEEHLAHMPPLASLESNQVSCISSGCHNLMHNVSQVDHMKMWAGGVASTSLASGLSPASAKAKPGATVGPSKAAAATTPAASGSSSVPAKAKPGTTGGASKAATGSSAGAATTARGKAIFDSQRCSGCHGKSGGGGSGPALTHISSQYPPAKLTALLKAPTAKMKAAGMVPLTLKAADMEALVSYVTSLGGKSAASAATPQASGSSSPAPSKTEPSQYDQNATPPKINISAYPPKIQQDYEKFNRKCSECHSTESSLKLSMSPAQWKYWVGQMAAMPSSNINDKDAKEILAFLNYDEAHRKAAAKATTAKAPAAGQGSVALGRQFYLAQNCDLCHSIGGKGGSIAPPLDNVGSAQTRQQLIMRMQGRRAGTIMPPLPNGTTDQQSTTW